MHKVQDRLNSTLFSHSTKLQILNSVTEFRNTNNGYVKFAGTYGLVIPVGDNTNGPRFHVEEGMILNTADGRVEVYDGTSWDP